MVEPLKSYPVEEIVQAIMSSPFQEDLSFLPEQQRRFYVSNVVQRTLSHLFAFDGAVFRKVACNSAGYLKTVSGGTALTTIAKATFAGVTTKAAQDLGQMCQEVLIKSIDKACKVSVSKDGVTDSAQVSLSEYAELNLEIECRYVHIEQVTAACSGEIYGLY